MSLTADLILNGLLTNNDYAKKVMPFLQSEYFDGTGQTLFGFIKEYVGKYNNIPPQEAVAVMVENSELQEKQYDEVIDKLSEVYQYSTSDDIQWMTDETEKYCKDQALHNAITEAISIYNGDVNKARGAIPDLVSRALAIEFDSTVGHSFFDDTQKQADFYADDEVKFPFDIDIMNKMTGGGIPAPSLNIYMGPINSGKSIWLCHQAAHWTSRGKNVLFITGEMEETAIRHRVDANLLRMNMGDVQAKAKANPQWYIDQMKGIRKKTCGELFIKGFAAGEFSTAHIKRVLDELKLKRNFVPDMICVDYLGIMACEKLQFGAGVNSNTYYTEIAKELHALAKRYEIPVWTAMQLTRDKQTATDAELSDVASAIGVAATADFVIIGLTNEELEAENQIVIKQVKNRYNTKSDNRRALVGLDRAKMTFFDMEVTATTGYESKKLDQEDELDSAISSLNKRSQRNNVDMSSEMRF